MLITRKNAYGMGDSISTLNTYQIMNIETKKHLYMNAQTQS